MYKQLQDWGESTLRKPLLLRGARQTGKTYIVREYAKANFRQYAEINFETQPELKACFSSLNPVEIINRLQLVTNASISVGETLLFFDEIQECPQAIQALRYFKEELRDLHVIGAGSLLEFALNEEGLRMPVGRVESLYLKPFSFMEFLLALGEHQLYDYIQTVTILDEVPEEVHQKLIGLARCYSIVGGMPEAIDAYLQTKDLLSTQKIQRQLLNTYRNDFSKYASSAYENYCEMIFQKAPGLIAQHVKYTDINPDVHSRFLKQAMYLLQKASILHLVHGNQANGLPLVSQSIAKRFKWLFLDIGLVSAAMALAPEVLLADDLLLINRGNLAEQLVGQELLAYQQADSDAQIFYWERNAKSSTAEVDYMMSVDNAIVPIEVKSCSVGRLKSMRMFMDTKKSPLGIVVSQQALRCENQILCIPFYLLSQFERLVREGISATS